MQMEIQLVLGLLMVFGLATAAIVFGTRLIRHQDSFRNFIGLMIVGMAASSIVLGSFGLVFGFIPVLINSIAVTLILRGKK